MYNEFDNEYNAQSDTQLQGAPVSESAASGAAPGGESIPESSPYASAPQPGPDPMEGYFARPQAGPSAPAAPVKKKKGSHKAVRAVALVLCCALVGGAAGTAGALIVSNRSKEAENTTTVYQGQRENTVLQLAQVDTGKEMTAAEVYAANVNSTVGITTSITTNFWGYQTTSAVSGSGFIITEDGYILTNYHVIADSNAITVSLYDGTTYDATLIGYDESNDIAVLKVDAQGLTPVVLGDSENVNVGDTVIAIGNPLGELTFSLTQGVVSALNREVTFSGNVTMDLIQTDCAINSGNSGGALFNLHGEVIGITNAKYSSSSGSGASIDNIGFAIPMNHIKSIVQSIMEKGYISKAYIGVTVTDVSAETQRYGLPQGASVYAVAEDSPAEEAGLQVSDIITKVNDTEITGSSDLVRAIGNAAVGDVLNLTVYRQGQTLELTVTVGEQIQSAMAGSSSDQQTQQNQQGGQYAFPWGYFGGN